MPTGATFLRRIDEAQQTLESAAQEESTRLHKLRLDHTKLRSGIARLLLEIARTQSQALDRNEIAGYDRATRALDDALEQRARDAEQMALDQERSAADLQERRKIAHALGDKLDQVSVKIAEIDTAAREALGQDPEFHRLSEQTKLATEQAISAKGKAEKAGKERTSKSGSYLADPLFSYLQEIGFGTPVYRAGPVVRTIDGWIAQLCNFQQARKDFEALQQLPEYLADHAQAMDRARADALAQLESQERRAREGLGIAAPEQERARLQAECDKAHAQAEKLESALDQRKEKLRLFAEWRDPTALELQEQLAGVLESETVGALQTRVQMTASDQDDRALRELMRSRELLLDVERQIRFAEEANDGAAKRLEGLRSVRTRYKRENYHGSDYSIRGSAAEERLRGFLEGTVIEADLWHVIRNSAKYDPPTRSVSTSTSWSSSSGGSFG